MYLLLHVEVYFSHQFKLEKFLYFRWLWVKDVEFKRDAHTVCILFYSLYLFFIYLILLFAQGMSFTNTSPILNPTRSKDVSIRFAHQHLCIYTCICVRSHIWVDFFFKKIFFSFCFMPLKLNSVIYLNYQNFFKKYNINLIKN